MADDAMETEFVRRGAELLPELVSLRRALHRTPEIGLDLPRTQALVLEALDGLGLEIILGEAGSSVTAVLRGGRGGGRGAVLLRGDMDALPVREQTGLDFASENGCMHACGHDLHTAGLVGAARLLAERRSELAGDVIFMFQPGEEGPGGAAPMIEEGVLEAAGTPILAAYAIHMMTGRRGVFTTRPGTIMAGSNILRIRVTGRGGHGSNPSAAIDPVPAILEIAQALQTFVTRRFPVHDPVVISVTQLDTGSTAINVIPDAATLGATVRVLSAAAFERIAVELPAMAEAIARAHGCGAETVFELLYPVTVNDAERAGFVLSTLARVFGDDRAVAMSAPKMGAEDFSLVLERVPGAFLFLQASPDGLDPGDAGDLHSATVVFDDTVLGDQAAALASLAWSTLAPVRSGIDAERDEPLAQSVAVQHVPEALGDA